MKLTNEQLHNFVGRIKLKSEMKSKYIKQIDNLIRELRGSINKYTNMKVTSVNRAGSWKKGTALRPRREHPLDIDLVFFLSLDEAKAHQINTLHETLLNFLLAAYPTKNEDDFSGGVKTVGLVFKGTRLEADLVPVVPLKNNSGYVWQPEKNMKSGKPFITSITGQRNFTIDIKRKDSNYTSLVRMAKVWRSKKELELSSFAIELIAAYLVENEGIPTNLEDGVIRFFEFLSASPFPQIKFSQAVGSINPDSKGPEYIADPTYNYNNVLERTKPDEWQEITNAAEKAWETLTYAQTKKNQGDTVYLWKEIFGQYFNITPEVE